MRFGPPWVNLSLARVNPRTANKNKMIDGKAIAVDKKKRLGLTLKPFVNTE